MKKTTIKTILSAVILLGCGGGNGDKLTYVEPTVSAESFVKKLNLISPPSISNSWLAKDMVNGSPYIVIFDEYFGGYVAIDFGLYLNQGATLGEIVLDYHTPNNPNAWLVDPNTPAALDATAANGGEIFYEGIDTGLLYEDTGASEKDMLYAAKLVEEVHQKRAGEQIANAYGLSEEQGIRLATTISTWEELSTSREMTEADADAFSQDLFGINFNDINQAIEDSAEGDSTAMDMLIEKASRSIDTTPENMRTILLDLL